MKLDISDKAFDWFKDELDLESGEAVQFYVRYGGCGNFQSSFSLAMAKKDPEDPAVTKEVNHVTFYVEKKDEWYFDDKDLSVQLNEDSGEIEYLHETGEKQ
ncbi:HesB/YadR/YfhF family protein [Bacillus sp. H-16]|uniref:HesB/YadR/YfhF family protein n=1 Tax=Alteribacter salitolerans TaxID=2912333 RepID=UPI001964061D|nr:HesB/YadR/YfhF family protein [Alteribacter salitolerans]MBM7097886.1 HesB/YadR/YfhF family protein [Alteribacter salitolerans]